MTTIVNASPYVYTPYQMPVKQNETEGTTVDQNNENTQEHKMLAPNQMVRAYRIPKPATIKNYIQKMEEKFEHWLERYNSKPHEYDVDQWQNNIDAVLGATDNQNVLPDNQNNPQYVNVTV